MQSNEIIKELYDSVISLDPKKAAMIAQRVIDSGMDIIEAIKLGLTPGVEEIGRRFQAGQVYLPELNLSGAVLQAAMNVFNPELLKNKASIKPKGRVLIGTVKGDLHNIGKDLVAVILKANNFEVIDIGIDVRTFTFVDEAVHNNVDIIGLSALLTTTIPQQREVIEALKSEGLREQFKVVVGGGAVDADWAEKIGADGYGVDAIHAVELIGRLCEQKAKKTL